VGALFLMSEAPLQVLFVGFHSLSRGIERFSEAGTEVSRKALRGGIAKVKF